MNNKEQMFIKAIEQILHKITETFHSRENSILTAFKAQREYFFYRDFSPPRTF